MKRITLILSIICACAPLICHAQENLKLPLPDPGNVTLTLDEYNKLVELAARKPKVEQTPLPFVIKRAYVKLQVESDSIRGVMNLQGEVFRKGISKVSLGERNDGSRRKAKRQGSSFDARKRYTYCAPVGARGIRTRRRYRPAHEN